MHMIGGCAIMGMCVVWGLTASGDVPLQLWESIFAPEKPNRVSDTDSARKWCDESVCD